MTSLSDIGRSLKQLDLELQSLKRPGFNRASGLRAMQDQTMKLLERVVEARAREELTVAHEQRKPIVVHEGHEAGGHVLMK